MEKSSALSLRPSERSSPVPAGFLARIAESSLVLRPLRELCRGSLVAWLLLRLGRSMSGRTSWIGTRVARGPVPRDFPRAKRIALTSVLLGGVDRWFAIAPEAWRQSTVKSWLDRTFAPLDPAQRVRLTGFGILSAALTHALLGGSTLLDSWRALIVWGFASAIGLGLVAASGPLTAAWRSHR